MKVNFVQTILLLIGQQQRQQQTSKQKKNSMITNNQEKKCIGNKLSSLKNFGFGNKNTNDQC